jgi:hypothetical protein
MLKYTFSFPVFFLYFTGNLFFKILISSDFIKSRFLAFSAIFLMFHVLTSVNFSVIIYTNSINTI